MADITTRTETKRTVRFRLTQQDVLALFLASHPEFADHEASVRIIPDYSMDLLGQEEVAMGDGLSVVVVATKTEVS